MELELVPKQKPRLPSSGCELRARRSRKSGNLQKPTSFLVKTFLSIGANVYLQSYKCVTFNNTVPRARAGYVITLRWTSTFLHLNSELNYAPVNRTGKFIVIVVRTKGCRWIEMHQWTNGYSFSSHK